MSRLYLIILYLPSFLPLLRRMIKILIETCIFGAPHSCYPKLVPTKILNQYNPDRRKMKKMLNRLFYYYNNEMCLVLLFIVYYFHSFVFTSVIVSRKNDVIACVNVSFCSFFMIGRKKVLNIQKKYMKQLY